MRGCNVIAVNAQGAVLLVRHSYHARDTWMLPGGGLGRGESLLEAAARELAEETGCVLQDAEHCETITLHRSGWTNLIELICGKAQGTPLADGREIVEARFFAPDALPAQISAPVQLMISRWRYRSAGDQNGSSA